MEDSLRPSAEREDLTHTSEVENGLDNKIEDLCPADAANRTTVAIRGQTVNGCLRHQNGGREMAGGDAGEDHEGPAVRAACSQARGHRNPRDTDQAAVPETGPGPAGLPSPRTPLQAHPLLQPKPSLQHRATVRHSQDRRPPSSLRRNTLTLSKPQDAVSRSTSGQ